MSDLYKENDEKNTTEAGRIFNDHALAEST
jgi:hypothetical protein